MSIISIDPGAVHCGVAVWTMEPTGLWRCNFAVEMAPEACVDFVKDSVKFGRVEDLVGELTHVYIEGFWLKSGLDALRQAGSQMETTEVIGTVRHLCRWSGMPFDKVANGQGATITRLTEAGYRWASKGHGNHAKDAEAVGVRGLGLSIRKIADIVEKRDPNA